MLRTTEEAAHAWCPVQEDQRCVSTSCMAWRWAVASDGIILTMATEEHMKKAAATMPGSVSGGYCGLAPIVKP